MKKSEKAVELKHMGNNCCQAVLLAFGDELGMDDATLRRLGAPFGAGMGCFEATCGALCGAQMVLGLKDGDAFSMRTARDTVEQFHERAGAVKCGDLKGIGGGKMLCSCDDCVRHAAEIIENM